MYYPERPLEPPEPKPVCECAWCGAPLYAGDDAYTIDNDLVCENCKDGWIAEIKQEIEEPEMEEKESEDF